MKFYVSALVGVIIKVILQNAQCNNKDIYAGPVTVRKNILQETIILCNEFVRREHVVLGIVLG